MQSDSVFCFVCFFFKIGSHVHSEFWANLGYIVRLSKKKGLLRAIEMAQEGQSACG